MPVLPTTKLSRSDLADLNAFLTVENHRSFTKAAIELGITTSALSHSIRNLESRLGVRLLNRTSRTVSPTDAGAALAKRLALGFEEIGNALAELDQHRDRPAGRLRINVLSDGARLLLSRWLPKFLDAYPEVTVEVAVDDRMVDILAEGFDAGIRFGGTIPEDFIATPVSRRLRWVAAASPRYLNRSMQLAEPDDLKNHNCIQLRTGAGVIYRWEFSRAGEHRVVDVSGQLCVNETTLGIEMALAGRGIIYCLEERICSELERGELQIVLPDWSPTEPPLYIYYPGRKQMPPGLRELIEVLRSEASL
ncbi:LysR family transcriptional regulator [Pokkaliibacter plantistimulans]|uniref:LysR family transcriptional regulator n=1 Tax=Proteobacteria bacterium 228 TaxID=2083153 RepID=A0A2S5KGJ6_9PROT|nr:LysR family transcriptional regulator [Pokkaliibacter plantistimulans]PPC73924.1 LysR family transcriptional regulator [Pokkaliibacter plantistimulans]